jgi:predicted nucleic acid-binding protein
VELADTSAWTNSHLRSDVRDGFLSLVEEGQIATCDLVKLELLYSARDHPEFRRRRDDLSALRPVAIGPRVWQRALDVFEQLSALGPLHHRQVEVADLLIAAAAESAELPVLHYDRHFEVIASVTGQPVRALAPLGSL